MFQKFMELIFCFRADKYSWRSSLYIYYLVKDFFFPFEIMLLNVKDILANPLLHVPMNDGK
jgi:hypothetical protein